MEFGGDGALYASGGDGASFTRTVIIGSKNTVTAISPQTKGTKSDDFRSWSDGGTQTHDVIAPATATT